MEDEEPTDRELIRMALENYANWVETRNPLLSAEDYRQMGQKMKALDASAIRRAERLRALAAQYA